MGKSNNFRDNDSQSWIENELDAGVDRRVKDVTGDMQAVINIATTSGLTNGESYDKIVFNLISTNNHLLEYSLGGICQFQIDIVITSNTEYVIFKRPCVFNMLQENSDNVLQENGDILQVQGLIP